MTRRDDSWFIQAVLWTRGSVKQVKRVTYRADHWNILIVTVILLRNMSCLGEQSFCLKINKILYTWNLSFGPFCTAFLCCRFDSNWVKLLHLTKPINDNECNFVSPSIQTHTVTYPTHPIRYSNIQTVSNKSHFTYFKWKIDILITEQEDNATFAIYVQC